MRHNAAVRLRSSGWTVDESKTGMVIYRTMNFKEEFLHSTRFAFYLMGEELTKEYEEAVAKAAEGFYTCTSVILVDKGNKIIVHREDKTFKGKD